MCSVVEIRQEWYTYTVYPRFVTDQLSTFAHSRDSRDSVSKFWTFSFLLFFWKEKDVQSRQNALLIFKGAVSQDLGVVLRGSIDRCEHFCLTIPSEYYCHKKKFKKIIYTAIYSTVLHSCRFFSWFHTPAASTGRTICTVQYWVNICIVELQ